MKIHEEKSLLAWPSATLAENSMMIRASTRSDFTANKPRKGLVKQDDTFIRSPRAIKLCCNTHALRSSPIRSLYGGHIEAGRSARAFFFVHPALAFLRQSNVSLAESMCLECHKSDERNTGDGRHDRDMQSTRVSDP